MTTPSPAEPKRPVPQAAPAVPAADCDYEEMDIPIAEIDPDPEQPRQYFDEAEDQALADSIAADGPQNPGTVYRDPETGCYRLIAGERRWRVHGPLGLETMRVRVLKKVPDEAKRSRLRLLDNELSKPLSHLEKGFAWDSHMRLVGCTASALAQTLGTSVSTVTRAIKDAQRLCPALKERFRAGTLPPEIAEEFLPLPHHAQLAIANQYPGTLKTKAEVKAAVRSFRNGKDTAAGTTAGFTCEESGVRIVLTWTAAASGAGSGPSLAAAETALKILLKDLRDQGHHGLEKFKDYLTKKARAARKAEELAAAQHELARHAGTSGNGGNS